MMEVQESSPRASRPDPWKFKNPRPGALRRIGKSSITVVLAITARTTQNSLADGEVQESRPRRSTPDPWKSQIPPSGALRREARKFKNPQSGAPHRIEKSHSRAGANPPLPLAITARPKKFKNPAPGAPHRTLGSSRTMVLAEVARTTKRSLPRGVRPRAEGD